MEGIQISLESTGTRKDIQVVKISGYIDTTTSGELERVIQSLLREQKYKIIIDLKDVDYISSAGWGIFISEIKNIRTHHGDLKLCNMSETVNEVYELLEFSTILVSAKTVNDAVKLFGDEPGTTASPAAPVKPLAKPVPVAPKPEPIRPAAKPVTAIPPRPLAESKPLPSSRPASAPIMNTPRPAMVPVANSNPTAANTPKPVLPGSAPGIVSTPMASTAPVSSGLVALIDRIREVVKAHPDWGAWKIKGELNKNRGTQPKVGWGEVRAELKYNNLGSKKARFQFARGTQG